jgi:hypothetical protein
MQDYLNFVQDSLQDIANYKEQIQDLQQKIIDKCPFQVNDFVIYNNQKAYITKVKIGYPNQIECELKELLLNDKKGRKIITYFAKLHELTKISEHNN